MQFRRTGSFVVYLSCFGIIERTDGLLSHSNAIALVKYLHNHPVAKPLYIINVK